MMLGEVEKPKPRMVARGEVGSVGDVGGVGDVGVCRGV